MGEIVREVCIVSILCAFISSIAPEGGAKKVMNILCSVILMLIIIKPLASFDMEQYAQSLAKYRELEQSLSADAQQMSTRLNRLVIEDEYRAYIMDKARESGINISEAQVNVEWSTEGFWVPCEVQVQAQGPQDKVSYLSALIQTELGIPWERQNWVMAQ